MAYDYSGYDWNDPNSTSLATYDRLLSLGVKPQTAAGAVGSLMGESGAGLNTRALNRGDGADGSDSIGMGQWNASRAVALRQQAQNMGLPVHAPQAQIEHLATELGGTHRHVLRDLIAAGDDLGAGQRIWTRRYEVAAPATAHEDRRLANGQGFYQRVAGRAAPAPADPQTTGSIPAVQPRANIAPDALPARPVGALTTSPVAQPQAQAESGGFLGMNSMSDFGKRLQAAAAWIAPPANAQAALGFRNAETNEQNTAADNRRADAQLDLQRQAQAMRMLQANRPETDVSTSANGKFRVIQKKNPVTGEISFDRQAIPDDEQDQTKKYPKPPASMERTFNDEENTTLKNVGLLKDGEELRDMFRNGQVDMSLVGKAESELKTLADSGDQRAANAMRMRAYLQGAINNTLRNEKGVQTDSDAKRVASEILSGSSGYNNSQTYQWLGRYMDGLDNDVKARTGRAVNSLKRYGPDYDPDEYRSRTFTGYGDTARGYRESDRRKEKDRPYTGQGPQAPATAPVGRVTSPLMEGLQRRFGTPGGQ